jgi:hypothetical protein
VGTERYFCERDANFLFNQPVIDARKPLKSMSTFWRNANA